MTPLSSLLVSSFLNIVVIIGIICEIDEFFYKVTDYWSKDDKRCIKWDDEKIGIGLLFVSGVNKNNGIIKRFTMDLANEFHIYLEWRTNF